MSPQCSVVMSCFNAEHTVAAAINSILSQSFEDFEYIIVDDGSMDGTAALVLHYATIDARIVPILNDHNLGLAASLNRAIHKARSPYIVRMDADDRAVGGRLATQMAFMTSHPEVDICGTAILPVYDNARIGEPIRLPEYHDQIVQRIFKKTLVFHPTIIIRKEVFEKLGWYDPSLRWAEDADLWFRIFDRVKWHNLQEPLLYYTIKSHLTKKIVVNNLRVKIRGLRRRGIIWQHLHILMRDIGLYAWRIVWDRRQ